MRAYTKTELLALTPDRYLEGGFLDAGGAPKGELLGDYATAAANQLLDADLAPQEFAFLIEALRLLLPQQEGPPQVRAMRALAEALTTVARMIRQPNNEGLVKWSRDCAAEVRQEADIEAWLAHMRAVLKQYAVLASLPAPFSLSPPGVRPS